MSNLPLRRTKDGIARMATAPKAARACRPFANSFLLDEVEQSDLSRRCGDAIKSRRSPAGRGIGHARSQSPVSYIKHGRSPQKPSSSGMDGSPYLRRFQSNKPDACLFASMIGFRCRPMSTDTNNNRQADVRFRIASIMQAEEQARR